MDHNREEINEFRHACPDCPQNLPDEWVMTWWYLETRSWGDRSLHYIQMALQNGFLDSLNKDDIITGDFDDKTFEDIMITLHNTQPTN